MRVGVIGLGTMGLPMASNLLKAGFDVAVYNRTPGRGEELLTQGVRSHPNPADLAGDCDIVLVCVSDTPDVEEVLFGGASAVAEGIREGSLVIDCSTISPGATGEFACRLAGMGVGYVDAPVSGGSEGAIAGTLAVMCGGSEEDFSRARPVLDAIGGQVTHVGPVGSGQVAKAVNQVVIAGTYQSVAEGIVLAAKSGVDPRKVIDAIGSGAAASWVLDNRSENMIQGEYPLGFRVRLHRKDLAIALEAAEIRGVEMPVARQVAEAEDVLIEKGFSDDDVSALCRGVRNSADLPEGPL